MCEEKHFNRSDNQAYVLLAPARPPLITLQTQKSFTWNVCNLALSHFFVVSRWFFLLLLYFAFCKFHGRALLTSIWIWDFSFFFPFFASSFFSRSFIYTLSGRAMQMATAQITITNPKIARGTYESNWKRQLVKNTRERLVELHRTHCTLHWTER